MLKELNVSYVPQYPMGGRFFDAFIPARNLLLEFDGTFWHPEVIEDCRYGFQRKNMWVDQLKNDLAKKKGMKIIRIREESPVTKEQLKEMICALP
jgi:very-short-patch-repair endonuclease